MKKNRKARARNSSNSYRCFSCFAFTILIFAISFFKKRENVFFKTGFVFQKNENVNVCSRFVSTRQKIINIDDHRIGFSRRSRIPFGEMQVNIRSQKKLVQSVSHSFKRHFLRSFRSLSGSPRSKSRPELVRYTLGATESAYDVRWVGSQLTQIWSSIFEF